MRILRFTLSGRTAFFKKPETNTYLYFSYGNIHKVALMGMFGAILGYRGYDYLIERKQKKKTEIEASVPEFYEKLKDIKISIAPNTKYGHIQKKIQSFNNSVGYASKEQGGNLIVKEQWLEKPTWDIYVLIDCSESQKLEKAMKDGTCIYIPYLGKNDHFADIKDVGSWEEEEIHVSEGYLHCLFPKKTAQIAQIDNDDDEKQGASYSYEEMLPTALNLLTNQYLVESFLHTDAYLEQISSPVYQINKKNIVFY